ncbi:MAG TPA: hypothetical protein VMM36_09705 [Opitutaceae bacterium]|nr:hypothetical protein [Opitutaceae bacterium]
MTSTIANPTSSNLAPSAAGAATGSLVDLMQAFAGWPGSGPRAATDNFDSLLAPGAERAPRAVLASAAQSAALPEQALDNAAATSRVGIWSAMQPVDAGDELAEVEAIEPVQTGEPLRSELETTATMLLAIIQALPAGEPTRVADATAAESTEGTSVSIEIPGEPEFTVTVPRARQAAAVEALGAAVARISDRESEANAHAAPQSRGARALETLTALGAGQVPPKQVQPPAENEVPSPPASPVEAEIQLPAGGTIRLWIKPAEGVEPREKASLAIPGAEIALSRPDEAAPTNATAGFLKKTFLSVVDKQLTRADRRAGITAAKSGDNMPDQASPSLPSKVGAMKAPESVVGLVAGATGIVAEKATEAADPVQSVARRAVDTAVNLMEIQAGQRGRNLSTVSVRMKLAGEDLAIRVELRDGEVHTSFRTASSDLRAAIGKEWQTAAAESPQRILRFHEPEFSNLDRNLADRGASDHSGREGNPAREQAHARREAGIERGLQHRTAAAPSIVTSAIPDVVAPGSQHLSTFA